jgi:NADH-quinone oxidoreductase subunit G
VLDEIARLVPGYAVDRMNLLRGNDVQTEPGLVPVAALTTRGQITPARDGLFTSGTLGQHSAALQELARHQAAQLVKIRTM